MFKHLVHKLRMHVCCTVSCSADNGRSECWLQHCWRR